MAPYWRSWTVMSCEASASGVGDAPSCSSCDAAVTDQRLIVVALVVAPPYGKKRRNLTVPPSFFAMSCMVPVIPRDSWGIACLRIAPLVAPILCAGVLRELPLIV